MRLGVAALAVGLLALPAPTLAQPLAVKVKVRDAGLYLVTPAALAGAGVNVAALDPRRFRVTHRGADVSIRVWGESDGRLDPQDGVEFYAAGISRDDPLRGQTDIDVYWLWLQGPAGPRMAETSLDPTGLITGPQTYARTLRMEEDQTYASGLPIPDGADRWLWGGALLAGDSMTLPFRVTALAGTEATLHVWLQGATDDHSVSPNHRSRVYVNGCVVGEAAWTGFAVFEHVHAVPAACLVAGTNTLTVESLGVGATVDGMLLDRFEVDYVRGLVAEDDLLEFTVANEVVPWFRLTGFSQNRVEVLDVGDPDRPRVLADVRPTLFFGSVEFRDDPALAGRHYLAVRAGARVEPAAVEADRPSALASPANRADHIIITHPDLLAGMVPLVAHREAQGLRAALVDVTDIYDEFADGLTDPAAIKRFLAYAYENWQRPAPLYVLLAGDATINFKTADGWEGPNYVPTHFFTTPDAGAAPDDGWFATVSGNDPIPDLFMGRLPVRPDTVDRTVAKIIAYDTQATVGWMSKVTFAASDVSGTPVFEDVVDDLASLFPVTYDVDRLFIRTLGGDGVRTALHAAIEDGRLITTFSGHGGGTQWALEKVLVSDDAETFHNGPRLTFLIGLNCATGYFVEPFDQAVNGLSLSEAFVTAPAGAVGAWMVSWKGYLSDQKPLGRKFMEGYGGGERHLGALAVGAQAAALAGGISETSVRSFNLLADPATALDKGGGGSAGGPGPGGPTGVAGGGGCVASRMPVTWGDVVGLLACLLLPLGSSLLRRRHA